MNFHCPSNPWAYSLLQHMNTKSFFFHWIEDKMTGPLPTSGPQDVKKKVVGSKQHCSKWYPGKVNQPSKL